MPAIIGMLIIDTAGFASTATQVPSPNSDCRPDVPITLAVVHGIALPPGCFGGDHVTSLFTNCLDPDGHPYFREIAELRVSAHFLIRRGGELVQFVSCNMRAWHAGISQWRGVERCNDFSIGIELEGCDDVAYEDAQYARLAELLAACTQRYPLRDIAGHSDIAPGRKTDPGPAFDWERLAAELRARDVALSLRGDPP